MGLLNTLRFIVRHPLNSGRPIRSVMGFVRWQLVSRVMPGPAVVPFVNDSRLIVARGMTGATMNIYTGLQEFEDMAFVLHLLRPSDLFVDVGANVGTYTVLAGATGAASIALEPVPSTFANLLDNLRINGLDGSCAHNVAAGNGEGELRFTSAYGPMNHALADNESQDGTVTVPVRPLDAIVDGALPTLLKIDVEGFETNVLAGASATLSNPSLYGIIIELNGLGARYGFSDEKIHEQLLSYGFSPYAYEPMTRVLVALDGVNRDAGTTLYLRNLETVRARVQAAPSFRVRGKEV